MNITRSKFVDNLYSIYNFIIQKRECVNIVYIVSTIVLKKYIL
jgi:hypothetical protein